MFSKRSSKNYRAMRDCIIGNPCALVLLGSYLAVNAVLPVMAVG